MVEFADARATASHPDLDELADLAEGLTGPERTATLRDHLQTCTACTDQAAALRDVTRTLGSVTAVAMPTAVADRLQAVLTAEGGRRAEHRVAAPAGSASGGGPGARAGGPHPGQLQDGGGRDHRATLGSFGGTPAPEKGVFRRSRFLTTAAGALALAVGVGFGAYVLSASSGLHEPTASGVVEVHAADLGPDAAALARRSDLDAYTFSQTWRCANRVVQGRITGLVPVYVDGNRATLVYTRTGGRTVATVVTGCPSPGPTAGPSAVLPR